MSLVKKVGNKSVFSKSLWTCFIVYLLLIATIFTISIPVLANNPPGVEIVEPGAGSTVSGVVTIWIVAWDADGNDQIQDVWVKIDSGDYQNATYNHTDGEGQWWYFEWDTTEVEDGWHHITAMAFDGFWWSNCTISTLSLG